MAEPRVRFSKMEGWIGVPGTDGNSIYLSPGAPIDADHPLVKARPELFSDEPPMRDIIGYTPPPVETATAEPGEVRTTARTSTPKKKAK